MNCQRFEDVVSELARGQMMEADLRQGALDHSEECLECRRRLADEQSLTRGLRALSATMEPLGASNELESRLRAAMNEQVAPPVATISGKPYRKYWLAVAAAVLLFVASAIVLNWQRQTTSPQEDSHFAGKTNEKSEPRKPDQPHDLPPDQPKEREMAFRQSDEPLKAKPRKVQPRSVAQARPSRKGSAVVANHAREIATDFIPLGFVNAANLQDGGHIVRVELPRSALVSFGLPVNMDRFNEKVKADVWLGVDGLAHAIRFVQ